MTDPGFQYFSKLNINGNIIQTDPRDRLDLFRHHRCNAQCIGQAVIDLLAGLTTVETFAIAQHPDRGSAPGKIHFRQSVRLTVLNGYKTFRYCGLGGTPNDYGSVIGSHDVASNPYLVTGVLAQYLTIEQGKIEKQKGDELYLFRISDLPENYDPEHWLKPAF